MPTLRPIAILGMVSTALLAQPTPASPAFLGVSISLPTSIVLPQGGVVFRGTLYDARQMSLLQLISVAYGVPVAQISGGPTWIDYTRFDVKARTPPGTTRPQANTMLQLVLTERFGVFVHRDQKADTGYALVMGEGKHKMKPATGKGPDGCRRKAGPALADSPNIVVECLNVTMDQFAPYLGNIASGYLPRGLTNQTSFAGAWDFDLEWTPLNAPGGGTTLFAAVEKQLGLKLQSVPSPTDVLVVERAYAQPTPDPPGVSQELAHLPLPAFDLAVIRPTAPGITASTLRTQDDQLVVQNMALSSIVSQAFRIISPDLLPLGQKISETRFDITAHTPDDSVGSLEMSGPMMVMLLQDRFELKAHYEDRPVTAYSLAANKPKLHPADPAGRIGCNMRQQPGAAGNPPTRIFICTNVTMKQFIRELMRLTVDIAFRIPVEDETSLEGSWDITVNFSPNVVPAAAPVRAGGAQDALAGDPSYAITFFDAVKPLGLKFEPKKRLVPGLVIDHILEMPTEN